MYLKLVKPIFDFILSFFGLLFLSPFLILIWIILLLIHKSSPIFFQKRVGQYGEFFTVYKFKTIKENSQSHYFLKLLRKTKIDELPQLLNVLKGDMSLVGPRPDIPGYYDKLKGEDRLILQLKPGITGYASLKFVNEEQLLAEKEDPLAHNDTVLFPQKVKLNLEYYQRVSFTTDLKILLKTILLPFYH
ncbi:sugar transferase [Psychroflexus sp. CAK8W]|uniref:Sugar transferase n=1 Tax=Psychroflexus longus TaxID=2873596 RepID=A0ABS7XEH0_9FLAO|nr:sugar transferase [Psychroflexus longus]MBZ9777337.1 sugar transferase [Psychroflexus longus]